MASIVNGIQKIVQVGMKDLNNADRLLVLPSPENVVWGRGIEEQIVNQVDDLGVLYVADTYVTGRDPVVTLTFGRLTREVMAMKLGFRLENQADTGIFLKTIQVKSDTLAAVTTGMDGFGMVADQATTQASVLRDGLSIPLTRQPFGTFAAATADSFAQGENGAFKFSTNLVTAREFVTVYATYPLATADVLSQTPFEEFSMTLIGVLLDKSVFSLKFEPVKTQLSENSEMDFGAENFEVPFRITDPGCVPSLKFFNRIRKC